MCCIARVIFQRGSVCDSPVQPVEMLMSFASSDIQMQLFLRTLTSILINEEVNDEEVSVSPPVLKSIALQNLLVLCTVSSFFCNILKHAFIFISIIAKSSMIEKQPI